MRNPYDAIGRIGLLLAIVGAVNWLLVGLFEWNLVQWIFTQSGTQTVDSVGERIVYIVVGVGGVLAIPMLAAGLARARSRDIEHTERDSSDRYVETDDTAYYLGAPKNQREETREPRPLRVADSPRSDIDERLRYGTVEETDEGYEEGAEERRRAA